MGFGTHQDPNTAKTRTPRKSDQRTIMRNPHDRAIQAHKMMVDKLDGQMTLPQIARKYDCTPETATKQLQYARDHGLYIDRARQLIESQLLPRALGVYEKYLDGTGGEDTAHDLEAARDILFGLGALSKSTTVKHTPSDVADTLDSWREKYFEETAAAPVVTVSAVPSLPPASVEPPDQDGDEHGDEIVTVHSVSRNSVARPFADGPVHPAGGTNQPANNDADDDGA